MVKPKNPAAGKRQGFGIKQVLDKPAYIVASIDLQPDIDVVELLARRTGVSTATVRMHCETFGIGGLSQ